MSKSPVENTDFILTGWQIVPAQIGNGFSQISVIKESFQNGIYDGSLSYCPAGTDEFFKIKKTIFLK
jgi:hypothetical protein